MSMVHATRCLPLRCRFLLLFALLTVPGCHLGERAPSFRPVVNPRLAPPQSSVPDAEGNPQPVAASRDARGIQTDFLEGVVLVRPRTAAQLADFLRRYNGTVVRDDTIPVPPAGLRMTLTDDQRRPKEYVVRIDLATVDTSSFAANGAAKGMTGVLEFSSRAGLQTMAAVADASVTGIDASPDFVSYPQQAFPITMFSTQERPNPPAGFSDAFTTTRFGTGGSQSNVTLAWQYLSAHGIARRVQVAIIDSGFLLNTNGTAQGADSDFPVNPVQFDFVQNDFFADGPNTNPCAPTNPCCWHGTGAAGVATGIINNQLGAAGTGGLIADPILLKVNGVRSQSNWAIRTALAWGADVVSMSWGGDCNQGCRIYDRDHTPFDDAVDSGSRAVFVASAGNGDSAGNGYDTGDPRFYHPCIEDHVICVGALNNDSTNKMGYSNFGRVTIFATTNVPVMSRPSQPSPLPVNFSCATAAPLAQGTFGGTSASAPFVAGIAAMMKAINPNLSGDEVSNLLQNTAHTGAGPVTRYVDAYQAVRAAANAVPMVRDRFDSPPAGNDLTPTDLGTASSYSQANLNVDSRDRDVFKVQAPASSTMTVTLQYPEPLGAVQLTGIEALGECALPKFVSDVGLGGTGHRLTWTVPGGGLQLGVRGADVNAYNVAINFATPAIPADIYEANDSVATATRLFTLLGSRPGGRARSRRDARANIAATIHTAAVADRDFYIVRGARPTLSEQILLNATSGLKLYGNESPVTLGVFLLNPDNTPGALVASLTAGSCTAQPLFVPLVPDTYYLVQVTGSVGRYSLKNGVEGSRRHIPELVRDAIYVVLHPLEPVEHEVRVIERYLVAPEIGYSGTRLTGSNLHMQLLDFQGRVVAEGQPLEEGSGERLTFPSAIARQTYLLQVVPQSGFTAGPMKLEWESATAARTTENLIRNPGAETQGGSSAGILGWQVISGIGSPQASVYADRPDIPGSGSPGPQDRGEHLFSGGRNNRSGIRQSIRVDPGWKDAIRAGRVKAEFSAFLGGLLEKPDSATATLTFQDARSRSLGRIALAPVTALDREGKTGLLSVGGEAAVPPGTAAFVVEIRFAGSGRHSNAAFADNVSLVLADYSP
jgi:Subtilase family